LHVGVDGCHSGWCFAAPRAQKGRAIDAEFDRVATFSEILGRIENAGAIAVDIPIGLPSAADPFRDCDREAGRKLKPPRASCVFPAPREKSSRNAQG